MSSLANDYISDFPSLRNFYTSSPRALFEAPPRGAGWDPALADALRARQSEIGSSSAFAGNEAVIATGQQPGLLTGPLYTIYKAVTAIKAAETVQARTGVSCVPVFWIGGDDHDFEEARGTHILTRNHDSLALRYEPEQDVADYAMCRVPLEASLHTLVDEAAANAPGAEFREEICGFLHSSLNDSASLADWCARIMARLFRDTPLVVFSPDLPEARLAAVPVFEKEIREPLESTVLLNAEGERLRDLGYEAQLFKEANSCNFFLNFEYHRRKVLYEDGTFTVPEEGQSLGEGQMLTLLNEAPERFTPNVALRCIVQQTLFPVAAYVAGPGEIAYWAQLKPVFERFGVPMPIVYPRARCVMTSIKLNKLRKKFGLGLDAFGAPVENLLDSALRAAAEHPGLDVLAKHRQGIVDGVAELADELAGTTNKDRSAADLGERFAEQVREGLDNVERKLLKSDRQKTEAVEKQVRRLCMAFAPERKPQERHYSVFSFLFEQGWGLIPRLLEAMDIESFETNEVEL